MHSRGLRLLPVLALLAATLSAVCSCNDAPQHRKADAAPLVDLSTREPLEAGTPRFWPTALGDVADSGYCKARLKLPLDPEPAWISLYTEAQFSAQVPDKLLNYDGLLIGSAASTQFIGIDAESGETVFNEDLYSHVDNVEGRGNLEQFHSAFINPLGLLVAQDDTGRYYCWDIADGEPRELWVTGNTDSARAGFVVHESSLLVNWSEELHSIDVATGVEEWAYPLLQRLHLQQGGGLASTTSGEAVSWSGHAGAIALSREGQLLWKTTSPDIVSKATIDESLGRVYLTYSKSEKIECRNLADGALIWVHRYSDLLSTEQRERMMSEAQRIQPGTPFEPVIAESTELLIRPEGVVVFSTWSGQVIKLDRDGQRLWRYDAECPVFGWIGYENGIIAAELYLDPTRNRTFPILVPYSLRTPSWSTPVVEDDKPQRLGRRNAQRRYVVLDPDSGKLLDSWKFERLHRTGPVPAGDKLVFGFDPLDDVHSGGFVAYNWLEVEGSN